MSARAVLRSQRLDAVQGAVSSSRIKYTAVAASLNYLVCGANTGSLYVFSRGSHEMLRLISNPELAEPVALLQLHPLDEDVLAIATDRFSIFFLRLNLADRTSKERILHKMGEHKTPITSLRWSNESATGLKLYSGDQSGQVYMTDAKKLVQKSAHLYDCNSPVYQLDCRGDRQLLISSLTQVYLIDFEKSKASKVGTKPRNGEFGACFHPTDDHRLLAARPSKNLWVADSQTSQVLSTMKLKDSLMATPNTTLLARYLLPGDKPAKWTSIQLRKLERFGHSVVCWDRTCLIVINPQTGAIQEWHLDVTPLQLVVLSDTIFLLHSQGDNNIVYRLDALPPLEYACDLHVRLTEDQTPDEHRDLWVRCARLTGVAGAKDRQMLQSLVDTLTAFAERTDDENAALQSVQELLTEVEQEREAALQAEREAEERRLAEEKQRQEEEQRRREEEEQRRLQEEAERREREEQERLRREEEAKRRAEEERERQRRRAEEEKRKEEERQQRLREEEARRRQREAAELRRIEEAERKRKQVLMSPPVEERSEDPVDESSEEPPLSSTVPEPEESYTPTPSTTTEDVPVAPSPLSTSTGAGATEDGEEGVYEEAVVKLVYDETPAGKKEKRRKRKGVTSAPKKRRKTPAAARLVDIAPPRLPSTGPLAPPAPPPQPERVDDSPPLDFKALSASFVQGRPQSSLSTTAPHTESSTAPPAPPPPPADSSLSGYFRSFTEKVVAVAGPQLREAREALDASLKRTALDGPMLSPAPEKAVAVEEAPAVAGATAETEVPIDMDADLLEEEERLQNLPPGGEDIPTQQLFQDVARVIDVASYITSASTTGSFLPQGPKEITLPESIQHNLSDWIRTLDPASPPHAAIRSLRLLVQLAFEHGISDDAQSTPHQTWTDETSLAFLQKFARFILISRAFVFCSTRQYTQSLAFLQHEQAEGSALTEASEVWIQRRAQYQKLRDQFQVADIANATSFISGRRDLGYCLAFLPNLLAAPEKHENVVALLTRMYPALRPSVVYQYLESDAFRSLSKLGSYRSRKLFIEYVEDLWRKYSKLQGHSELTFHYLKQCMLHEGASPEEIYEQREDELGPVPKFRMHLYGWGHKAQLMQVISRPQEFAYDSEDVCALCQERGFISGLLYFYTDEQEYQRAIHILLHADDQASLDELAPNFAREDWKFLLTQWSRVDHSNRKRTITKEHVVTLVLRFLGSEESVDLLQQCSEFATNLPTQVYTELLKIGKLSVQQEMILPKLLELLNSHLWSQRSKHIAPQLQYCLEKELTVGSVRFSDVDNSQPLPRYYEESQNHWGTPARIVLGTCPCCTLPLKERSAALVVFPCGHTYHQPCIPEMACRECFHMPSLCDSEY